MQSVEEIRESFWMGGGALGAVKSHGNAHSLCVWLGGRRWESRVSWEGPAVLAACECGGRICVVEDSQQLRVIENNAMDLWPLPGKEAPMAIAASNSNTVLVGGDVGILWECDLATKRCTRRKLRDMGVSKPGRTILNLVRTGGRLLVLGRNKLLAQLLDGSSIELSKPGSSDERSFNLVYASDGPGGLWVSGLLGLNGALGLAKAGVVEIVECPQQIGYAPRIMGSERDLFLLTSQIWEYSPTGWLLGAQLSAEDQFISSLVSADNDMIAVSILGAVYRRHGDRWIEAS